MTKSKTESQTVFFKGRFTLRKDQINAEIAFKLMMKCRAKPKSLVKTVMKIHGHGFHIGNPSGLVNIRKLWIYFKDIQNYYVFRNEPNGLILVNKVKDTFYMCYFCFQNNLGMTRICDEIEKLQPGEVNTAYQYEPVENEIEFATSSNTEEASVDQEVDGGEDPTNIDDFFTALDEIEGFAPDPIVIVHERSEPKSTFHSSKIDNVYNSEYEDLFIGPLQNTYEVLRPQSQNSDIIDGSVFLYSQAYAVPVFDLYGVCESDDEDA